MKDEDFQYVFPGQIPGLALEDGGERTRANLCQAWASFPDYHSRWRDNDLILPSKVGTPRDPSNLRLDLKQVLEKAGLPKIRFHDLRHTAASLMLNHGVPVIVASRRLGHSKPSTSLDIYGHLYQEMQDAVARKMDEQWVRPAGRTQQRSCRQPFADSFSFSKGKYPC